MSPRSAQQLRDYLQAIGTDNTHPKTFTELGTLVTPPDPGGKTINRWKNEQLPANVQRALSIVDLASERETADTAQLRNRIRQLEHDMREIIAIATGTRIITSEDEQLLVAEEGPKRAAHHQSAAHAGAVGSVPSLRGRPDPTRLRMIAAPSGMSHWPVPPAR